MKISYNWLREYVKTELSPRALAESLTCAGLAVDAVEPHGNDFVLDFDLTSNRPDALSHFGIAREAAAICETKAVLPNITFEESSTPITELTSVTIENPEWCPRYTARVLRGIQVGPSPEWLVERLAAVGQRSINNVVDVTNFVLLELGHPLHAFDYDKLAGHRIIVRAAREGERLTTLDDNDRALTPQMLVIADAEKAVAMGGVMGGAESEISEPTVNVLLESAYFEPSQVRRTARALELHTEASHRFERGADCELAVTALNRCTQLIQQVAGGEIVSGVVDVYPSRLERLPIPLRYGRIKALTGVEVPPVRVEKILTGLGFELETISADEQWRAVAPSHRTDIHIEEDLIEEVIRLAGYTSIPATLPGWGGAGGYLPGEHERRRIRQALVGQGFSEAISFSWISEARLTSVGGANGLTILNPIDKTEDRLRTTLLPGLLGAVAHNFNFGTYNLRMYETGKVFSGTAEVLEEPESLALVVTGTPQANDWSTPPRAENFHTLKGILENLFECLQIEHVRFSIPDSEFPAAYFPGQVAHITIDETSVGWVGRISASCAEHHKFKQPVYAAELKLQDLVDRPQTFRPYQPLPKFPSIERDISALLDTKVSYEDITREVFALEIPGLVSLRLREVFTGNPVPAGKHSLTLNLCYRVEDRTLTDQEVGTQHARVVALLQERLGAEIR